MSNPVTAGTARRESQDMHLVFGSGGTKAILAGAGAVLAIHTTGLKSWRSIGGASGGSIIAALFARDVSVKQVLHLACETDFSKLVTARTGLVGRLWAFLRKYRYEKVRPVKGVFSHESLRQLVDRYVPAWPERL